MAGYRENPPSGKQRKIIYLSPYK